MSENNERDRRAKRFEKTRDKIDRVDHRDWILLKYRWEFMRRDPEYIQSYAKEKSGERFGLPISMVDPNLGFEELLLKEGLSSYKLSVIQTPDGLKSIPNYKTFRHVKWLIGIPESVKYSYEEKRYLNVNIDLESVNSIDQLKKEISNMLVFYWCLEDRKTRKTMDFEKILEVGDLKVNNPEMSFTEIADIVYPEDESPESAVKKAQQKYSQYKDFTNGGWKNLKLV